MTHKIFLLVDDPVGERELLAAFSTREAANAALRFGGSRNTIEEVDLDPQLPAAAEGLSIWNVCVQGSTKPYAIRTNAFDLSDLDKVISEADECMVEVWGLDEEHAIRLGLEKIARYKKEQGLGA
jgi:hypothetical protein